MSDTPLTPSEIDALHPDDRTFLLDAWGRLTPDQEDQVRVLTMLTRAVVKHDTAPVHMAVKGFPELLDESDARSRELLDAAQGFRADAEEMRREWREFAEQMRGDVTAAVTSLVQIRTDLDSHMAESRSDRARLSTNQDRLWARQRADQRRFWLLVAIVAALVVDLLLRYAPMLMAALLSVVLMVAL